MSKKGSQSKLFERRKFTLSIGDEGAILVLMNGKKLVERYYIESPQSQDLTKALALYPDVPLYLLVDVLDQAYIQHTLPPVSALNIGQLVKRRLEKDFAQEDIKAARKLFRENNERKDWSYSFISVHNAPPFSDWLEVAVESPNPFKGLFLIPVESESFVKKLNAIYIKKEKKDPEWQLLVSHNKVGGFRQIVFRDGKVIFTRIAQPIGGQAPDVIAGNIEQETLNTIEYVRRLGFDNDEKLDIYIVSSQAVKTALETNALRARRVVLLTPFEIAEKFGFINTAEKTDRFGDVVLAASFVNSRPTLKFNTPYSKQVDQLTQASYGLKGATAALVPFILLLIISTLSSISEVSDKIDVAQSGKLSAQQQLDEVIRKRDVLPSNSEEVLEIVKFYQTYEDEHFEPFAVLKTFSDAKGPQALASELRLEVSSPPNENGAFKLTSSVVYQNPSRNIDRLLEDLDAFAESIKSAFQDYDVAITGLPSQAADLTLDNTAQPKDLDVVIEGPKEGSSQPRSRNPNARRR